MNDMSARKRSGSAEMENNPAHRLTAETAHEARTAYLFGCSQKEIASVLGVHQGTISNLVVGKLWVSR